MIFKLKYKKLGGHIHCDLFAARQPNTTFAKCGSLTFREEEWEDFLICCQGLLLEDVTDSEPYVWKASENV